MGARRGIIKGFASMSGYEVIPRLVCAFVVIDPANARLKLGAQWGMALSIMAD